MRQYAVIVAGGSGTRMGGGLPKQFRALQGKPVLWWSLKSFHEENPSTRLIVVLPEEYIAKWEELMSTLPTTEQYDHIVVYGGASRTESVKKGLSAVEKEDSLVAVHDGARPLVSPEMISRGWMAAAKKGSAIPVVPVTDSLREKAAGGSHSVDRNRYMAVQTPQVFHTPLLKEAYSKAEESGGLFTDDASVVENMGYTVHTYEGEPTNIKITNPEDLAIAKVLMDKHA